MAILVACASVPSPTSAPRMAPETALALPGVTPQRLTPEYWIARLPSPDAMVLDGAAIAAQNARLAAQDPAVFDLGTLPAHLSGSDVRARVLRLSAPPERALFDQNGTVLSPAALQALDKALALDSISEQVPVRFGLVTRRADLRSFPTAQRVFSRPGDTDIDRFQESALFPGTPVAILHASADGRWLFVVSTLYSAWIAADHVAAGSRDAVMAYGAAPPYLIITGATVRTVFTPDAPQVSELQLDMGIRLPVIADWPPAKLVNGQLPFASHVVALPVRSADGTLDFAPALVPRSADVSPSYLPLTRANLIAQAFKFLGERYGWGHSYGTRDCSGFVSEVYRSFGVAIPRNTRDQGVSTAFERIVLDERMDHAERIATMRQLDVGDLIYIPGHVMMVIGHDAGETWLIHDTTGARYRDASGKLVSVPINQVAVTPLFALLGDSGTPYIDFAYSVQRIRLVDRP
ncbi:MAG TPA: SH3 domain-containing protein [Chiayiivirga sp.]|nr:SH3 domain-containing protein [Chiayiivirga sp.]